MGRFLDAKIVRNMAIGKMHEKYQVIVFCIVLVGRLAKTAILGRNSENEHPHPHQQSMVESRNVAEGYDGIHHLVSTRAEIGTGTKADLLQVRSI